MERERPNTATSLQPPAHETLNNDIVALIAAMNRSGDATIVVPSEYAEIVLSRR